MNKSRVIAPEGKKHPPTISDFPNLIKAFELVGSDNGMTVRPHRQLFQTDVPNNWLKSFKEAEPKAQELNGHKLSEFIAENMIDGDVCSPDDDALEIMCNGEETYQLLLVREANAKALHEVLTAAFDGVLHDMVYYP